MIFRINRGSQTLFQKRLEDLIVKPKVSSNSDHLKTFNTRSSTSWHIDQAFFQVVIAQHNQKLYQNAPSKDTSLYDEYEIRYIYSFLSKIHAQSYGQLNKLPLARLNGDNFTIQVQVLGLNWCWLLVALPLGAYFVTQALS